MSDTFCRKSLSIVVPLALIVLSIPAFAAENATVTGDNVRVRDVPSISGEVIRELKKGARIEVTAKTDFPDTIGGHTAPWYSIYQWEWIFGGYVELDPGVVVPSVSLKSGDCALMAIYFDESLHTFGNNKSEIVSRLGQPLSETRREGYNKGDFFSEMVYDGLTILTYTSNEGVTVCEVTCTTDAYDFGGVKVGCSIADINRVFGNQKNESSRRTDGFDYIYYHVGKSYVTFKIERERVIEINFGPACID